MFQNNCEVIPLCSFANFKLIISRDKKELRWAQKARDPRPWPMRRSVTGNIGRFLCGVGV